MKAKVKRKKKRAKTVCVFCEPDGGIKRILSARVGESLGICKYHRASR
jgi:hypothetical protein